MITPAQSRAARALLNWSQPELADASGASVSTIRDFETGKRVPIANNLAALRSALEAAGVIFVAQNGEGPGVRLRKIRPGVKVRLVNGTSVWGQYQHLKDKAGEVTALVNDGTSMPRISVAYDGEPVFVGMDTGFFELVE